MLKVLLINPPQYYYKGSSMFNVYFPIGLISMASMIEKISHVRLLDCLIEGFRKERTGDRTRYGSSKQTIEGELSKQMPDIIGISAPFSAQKGSVFETVDLCRKVCPQAIIVIGGPDATVQPGEYAKIGDYVITGEGEITLYELVKRISNGEHLCDTDGIAFLKAGRLVCNKTRYIDDLDGLPLPAYHLLDMKRYFSNKYLYRNRSILSDRSISIQTSRGCPYSCTFCSIHLHTGRIYRAHSPEYVLRHIRHLISYGIRNFHFEDDNLTLDRNRFEQILSLIYPLGINWDTPNGVRADTLDYSLLLKMKSAGCKALTIAIESGEPRVLRQIKKNLDLRKVEETASSCKRAGLRLSAFYMIGLPGETISDMKTTADLAVRMLDEYDVIPNLNIATPLIGTELYDLCKEKKYISEVSDQGLSEGTQIYGTPLITTDEFGSEDIGNLLKYYKRRLAIGIMKFAARHPFTIVRSAFSGKTDLRSLF
ncbi:MAG: B12-binding domain-containing radical SAM protein [Nanoarchaeota archaeon]|nr:B12-binding domain-containing radical SAM protein [Nanoarchaeota archaeon]